MENFGVEVWVGVVGVADVGVEGEVGAVGVFVVGVLVSFSRRNAMSVFHKGKSYFFRTVTYHLIGKVKAEKAGFLELEQASWVADSGRFMQAIKNGSLNEVEPVGNAYVSLAAITDAFPWVHALPTEQK